MNFNSYPLALKVYVLSFKIRKKIASFFQKLAALLDACFIGFWLGALKEKTLHSINEFYYGLSPDYHGEEYNQQGLWDWETAALDKHFQSCNHLLVTAVGGGREVLALRRLGYEVDGFECHPQLVKCANKLLQEQGFSPNIKLAPPDQCPELDKSYDGLIVGWGSYSYIFEKEKRIAFLKQLRGCTQVNSPILASFFYRSWDRRYLKLITLIGNTIRSLQGRTLLELGDTLTPNYEHHFTEAEIASELQVAGFKLTSYSTKYFGHAVGIAFEEAGNSISSTASSKLEYSANTGQHHEIT